MGDLLQFKRQVDLEVCECDCGCDEWYLAVNGEAYCVECRHKALNIIWKEDDLHTD